MFVCVRVIPNSYPFPGILKRGDWHCNDDDDDGDDQKMGKLNLMRRSAGHTG